MSWRRFIVSASLTASAATLAVAAATIADTATAARTRAPAAAPAAARPGPNDTFTGRITGATGRFTGDHGRLTLYLWPGSATAGGARPLKTVLAGSSCRGAHRCIVLSGTLHGELTPGQRSIPDIGQAYGIAGTGTVRPLGPASAAGTVHSTGFIARGREPLQLTLTTRAGDISITAQSGLVGGFTSP